MSNQTPALRKAFGAAIRAERKARDWSQENLAERADISLNWVGALERGEQSPTLDTMSQLACAFGISVRDLMDKAKL